MTIKIGITGSIGMGKSTVASIFKKNRINVWDADAEVHKLYKKGKEGYNAIILTYPELMDEEEINREKLSDFIRKKKIDLKTIEHLIHPLLINSRLKFIEENKNQNIIVFDIPLLYETNANLWLDYVISVYCSNKTQIKRLSSRKSFDKKKIQYLLSKQITSYQKQSKANFLINTDQEIEFVEKEVNKIIKNLGIKSYD
ncbi:MAG: dephospho-CoA kinase [Paracoccaceae bacterium]